MSIRDSQSIAENNNQHTKLLNIAEAGTCAIGLLALGGTAYTGAAAFLNNALNSSSYMAVGIGIASTAAAFIANWVAKDAAEAASRELRESLALSDQEGREIMQYIRDEVLDDATMEFVRKSPEGGAWMVFDKQRGEFLRPMSRQEYSTWKQERAQEYKNAGLQLQIAEVKDPAVHNLAIPKEQQLEIRRVMVEPGFRVDYYEASEAGRIQPVRDGEQQAIYMPTLDGVHKVASISKGKAKVTEPDMNFSAPGLT